MEILIHFASNVHFWFTDGSSIFTGGSKGNSLYQESGLIAMWALLSPAQLITFPGEKEQIYRNLNNYSLVLYVLLAIISQT